MIPKNYLCGSLVWFAGLFVTVFACIPFATAH
jgi:hypothetical protein